MTNSMRSKMTICLAAAAAILVAGPVLAKEYNKPRHVPSSEQAMINRIQAELTVAGENQGAYGSFEDDCNELQVGTNSGGGDQPDSQVIIADTIINVAGHCRIRRRGGGFAQPPAQDNVPPSQQ